MTDEMKQLINARAAIERLAAELKSTRAVCAEAYQFAGALEARVEILDNLSDAANGAPLRHKTFLPAMDTDSSVVQRLTAELASMRAREEWMFGQGNGASWVDLHRYMSQSNNIEQARALIDADIARAASATKE